jgi:hypothetical protein
MNKETTTIEFEVEGQTGAIPALEAFVRTHPNASDDELFKFAGQIEEVVDIQDLYRLASQAAYVELKHIQESTVGILSTASN